MASTTVESTAPAGAPMLAKLAEKPRLCSSECSSAISAAPPHSPPTAKPWISRSRISRIGARMPMVGVGGEQADREAGRAHDAHGQHEHGFAADPVAEVAEDHPAEGADDVADGEGAERGDGRDHRGQVGEEQLPEHQRGGGAVEQEVVELDGAAQEAGEQHPAHLLGITQGAGPVLAAPAVGRVCGHGHSFVWVAATEASVRMMCDERSCTCGRCTTILAMRPTCQAFLGLI